MGHFCLSSLTNGFDPDLFSPMSDSTFPIWMALACVALLSLFGIRPYIDEFSGRWRRVIAGLLLVAVLVIVVFSPLTSNSLQSDFDLDRIFFPWLSLRSLRPYRLSGCLVAAFEARLASQIPQDIAQSLAGKNSRWVFARVSEGGC